MANTNYVLVDKETIDLIATQVGIDLQQLVAYLLASSQSGKGSSRSQFKNNWETLVRSGDDCFRKDKDRMSLKFDPSRVDDDQPTARAAVTLINAIFSHQFGQYWVCDFASLLLSKAGCVKQGLHRDFK